MLGLNRYKVSIVAPQPGWQAEYDEIASEIRTAASHIDLKVEHIGSTSVPGLAAKPIVDVGILLADPADFDNLKGALLSIDLEYRGDKGTEGGRLFIRESGPEVRTHHIHVYFAWAPEWDRYLIFRDRLRADPALREEYARLKRRLAQQYENDRFTYMAGKTEFVQKVLGVPIAPARLQEFDMKSVTRELTPPIAVGATADIHDWQPGQVLKLYRSEIPPAAGIREARSTRTLFTAGVRVPAVGELMKVNGRLGLPMEKLNGPPLANQLVDSESGSRAGRLAAELHASMHARGEKSLTPLRQMFRKVIEAGTLPPKTRERVLRTMEELPDGDRICHGDFHAGNIVMTNSGAFVIDCVLAHSGNPRADVAQTVVAMTEWRYLDLAEGAARAAQCFIQSYEQHYFELSPAGHDELAAWKPIVAAFRLGFPHRESSNEPLMRMVEGGVA
jgi:GrpB-like predicted nucleotidyltransferase (UPF0157 family)/tRNA A-37 threonylcarbamoyl transferase component Bud32